MKKNKKAIFSESLEDLGKSLKEARNDLFALKLDHSQFKLKNTRQISNKRVEIARMLSVIREKELVLRKPVPQTGEKDKTQRQEEKV